MVGKKENLFLFSKGRKWQITRAKEEAWRKVSMYMHEGLTSET